VTLNFYIVLESEFVYLSFERYIYSILIMLFTLYFAYYERSLVF